jgi:hypothetical protein
MDLYIDRPEVLEKCIPVLILQGSGKAADLIAECMSQEE